MFLGPSLVFALLTLASYITTSATAAPQRNRRRLQDGGIYCIVPGTALREVFFDAAVQLTSYYEPSRACNATELEEVGDYIDLKWDQFVADNEVLGPVNIELDNHTCQQQTLHRQLPVLRERFRAEKKDARIYSHGEEDIPEFMIPERHTPRQMGFGFLFRRGGKCTFCFTDNLDARRNLQISGDAPVTLYLETDVYADEAGYKIKDLAGNVVFSDSYVYRRHQRTMFLESGQFYFFEATDSYGDGWCCQYGNGNAKMYSGTPSQEGFMLLDFNGQFSHSSTIGFTVPYLAQPHNMTVANIFEINVVPQLQEDLSRHITYYIQQYFNSMEGHCLYRSWPQVWVDLTAGTNVTAFSPCDLA